MATQRTIGLLLAPAMLMGCYSYTTIDVANATPGMEVRARLSVPSAARIAPTLNMGDARTVSGEVVERQGDALTLKLPSVAAGTQGAPEGLFQQISINRSDMLELESKKLDHFRTGVIAAVAGVAVGAFVVSNVKGHSTASGTLPPDPTNFNINIILGRLHF